MTVEIKELNRGVSRGIESIEGSITAKIEKQ